MAPRTAMAEAGAFLEEFSEEEKASLSDLAFAVVVGRFYEDLAKRLVKGARAGFEMAGVNPISIYEYSVPGAYELPFAAEAFIRETRIKANSEFGAHNEPGGVACLG